MSDGSVCVEEQENRSAGLGEGRDACELSLSSVFSSQANMSWRNLILEPPSLK